MRPTHLLLLVSCALALAVAAPAGAIVPPKDCGSTTVKHKHYDIKADQLRCKKARKYARAYLKTRHKPSGYSCKRFSASQTKIAFRCSRGIKVFFAIRH